MAFAAVGFAKAMVRRQIMVVTASIGPGTTNLLTAAGVAHTSRLPLLMICGDSFARRRPDPVMQQVEHFNDPTQTVNDAFKAVQPLLGSHYLPGAAPLLSAAGGRHHARSRRLVVRRLSVSARMCRRWHMTIRTLSFSRGYI
ncbi:3D-(3,5/4)-trihydroxycyclohexane-1,2-dione hydrolase [Raoultella planticola]|uniref:3D-(3,5/4)-trihydroxycyclohexane-1,2-dione hydrolase n=1 Tax=Raoultella planticola TaxID=575 RepID=A0A485ATW8_RAOPL|nr:3D-(3,5/4)-trihydroxycyclohexane-1,2-dione hydrolase [Raoultella planticola]